MATAYHLEALRRQRINDRRAEAKRKLEEKERSPEESGHTEPASSRGSSAHSNASRKSKASPASSKHTTPAHSRASTAQTGGSRGSTAETGRSRASTAETGRSRASTAETGRSRASTAETGHSRASKAGKKSKSMSPEQSRVPSVTGDHSRQSSRNSQTEGSASRGMTSEGRGATGSTRSSSKQPTPDHSRPSTAPGSCAASCKQSQHRLGSSSAGSQANELHGDGKNGERGTRISNTAELKAEAVRRDLKKQELVLRDSNLVMGTVPLEEEMEMEGRESLQSDGHVASHTT